MNNAQIELNKSVIFTANTYATVLGRVLSGDVSASPKEILGTVDNQMGAIFALADALLAEYGAQDELDRNLNLLIVAADALLQEVDQ